MICFLTVCQTEQIAQRIPNLSAFLPACDLAVCLKRPISALSLDKTSSKIMAQEGWDVLSDMRANCDSVFLVGLLEAARIRLLLFVTLPAVTSTCRELDLSRLCLSQHFHP